MRLRSFKDRLLLLAVSMSALLIAMALFSTQYTSKAISGYQKSLDNYSHFEHEINKVEHALRNIEAMSYQYSLLLEKETPGLIRSRMIEVAGSLNALQSENFIKQSKELRQSVFRLNNLFLKMHKDTEELLETLAKLELRFPGMNILLDTLAPTNTDFMNYNLMALQSAGSSINTPLKLRVLTLFKDIQYYWAQQVSSVRVFIANRSGVFGDPLQTMRSNILNREVYSTQVRQLLDELEAIDDEGHLSLEQSESLDSMNQLWKKYERHFAKVKQIVYSDYWRLDIKLIKDKLRPLYAEIWQSFVSIRNELEAYVDANQNSYGGISSQFNKIIWSIVSVLLLLLLGSVIVYDYFIRRPVLDVAYQLEQQGLGNEKSSVIRANTEETIALVDAFQRMREQVKYRQNRLENVFDSVEEGIITFDANGKIEASNIAAQRLFQFESEAIIGKSFCDLIKSEQRSDFKSCISEIAEETNEAYEKLVLAKKADGSIFSISMKLFSQTVDDVMLFTAIITDITEQDAIQDHMKNIAQRDPLTGIFNRQQFLQEVDRILSSEEMSEGTERLLLYVGIDNFKYVNDTQGIHVGDRVITELAELLLSNISATDIIARVGGDEFGILLNDVDCEQIELRAAFFKTLIESYEFNNDGMELNLTCSIGACRCSYTMKAKEELLARAGLAYTAAKREGKNRVHFYVAEDEKSLADMSNEINRVRSIRRAIEENRFVMACQSIVNTHTGQLSHYEVLLRLMDEDGHIVFPNEFMPTAERFGMMQDIDMWVIRNGIAMLAEQRRHSPGLKFALNLSGASFAEKKVLNLITEEIHRHNIPPMYLTFEITETVAISNLTAAVEFLNTLRRYGCETSLDDFGTGYSSFAYLKDLPADYVKIDGSFVCDIDRNESHMVMVRSMNEVAHAMGKKTIAEYVENESCMRVLKEIGVDYCQGYYFDKPQVVTTGMRLQPNVAKLGGNVKAIDSYR